MIFQHSSELGRWYILEHGGRYFLNADKELTFQRQFTDGMWDGPEIVEDYENTDEEDIIRIDCIKAELQFALDAILTRAELAVS